MQTRQSHFAKQLPQKIKNISRESLLICSQTIVYGRLGYFLLHIANTPAGESAVAAEDAGTLLTCITQRLREKFMQCDDAAPLDTKSEGDMQISTQDDDGELLLSVLCALLRRFDTVYENVHFDALDVLAAMTKRHLARERQCKDETSIRGLLLCVNALHVAMGLSEANVSSALGYDVAETLAHALKHTVSQLIVHESSANESKLPLFSLSPRNSPLGTCSRSPHASPRIQADVYGSCGGMDGRDAHADCRGAAEYAIVLHDCVVRCLQCATMLANR
jgi:hypothetical protein